MEAGSGKSETVPSTIYLLPSTPNLSFSWLRPLVEPSFIGKGSIYKAALVLSRQLEVRTRCFYWNLVTLANHVSSVSLPMAVSLGAVCLTVGRCQVIATGPLHKTRTYKAVINATCVSSEWCRLMRYVNRCDLWEGTREACLHYVWYFLACVKHAKQLLHCSVLL